MSTIDTGHGWRTYSIRDIFIAVNQTYRSKEKKPGRSLDRFMSSLEGRQRPSAGHISTSEISFAEEISEIDGLLNFYMETNFDVDAVFGTHVCTGENDDTLNATPTTTWPPDRSAMSWRSTCTGRTGVRSQWNTGSTLLKKQFCFGRWTPTARSRPGRH